MKSYAHANEVLEYVIGRTTLSTGARTIKLWTVLPDATGLGGTQLTGFGYAARATTEDEWGEAEEGSLTNLVDLSFGAPDGNQGPYIEGLTIEDGTKILHIVRFPDRRYWDREIGFSIPQSGLVLAET